MITHPYKRALAELRRQASVAVMSALAYPSRYYRTALVDYTWGS